jgi:hypothetical protein
MQATEPDSVGPQSRIDPCSYGPFDQVSVSIFDSYLALSASTLVGIRLSEAST